MTVTEMRLAIARRRVDTVTLLHGVDWRSWLGAAVVAAVVAGLTVTAVRSATGVFLPPDGAHYIADADSLLGNGVRELRHPPVFPALVALVRPFTGEADSFLWAMTVSVALFVVALYTLLRRWLPSGPSLVGAAAGGLTPVLAELFGWGGGATLLGTAMLVFTLAAMEAWIQRGGKRGFLVGVCLALTALTHALALAAALGAVGVRALVLLVKVRKLGAGWDPLGWRGIASVLAVSMPAFLLAFPLYFGPAVSIGGPRPRLAWDLLVWALKEGRGGWLLALAAAIGIQLSEHRGLMVYALFLFGVVLAYPALLDADITYANRAEYLVPIVIALGVGSLAAIVQGRLRAAVREWLPRPAFVMVVVFGLLAFMTYLPRLERATAFFNVWVTPEDVRLIESLRGDEGTIATSWRAHDFGTGVNMSWIAEGLAKRPAFGAADASLASLPAQLEGGSDMQLLFAGTHGLDNDALQVVSAPMSSAGDLSIQIRSEGLGYPFLFVRSQLGSYPVDLTTVEGRLDGGRLVWTFRDDRGRVVMSRSAQIDRKVVTLRYELDRRASRGRWAVELAPAPGMSWSDLRMENRVVKGTIAIRGDPVDFAIRAPDARVHARVQGGSILVRAQRRSSFELKIRVDTPIAPGTMTTFEEEELLVRYGITNVVVLSDTGLTPRFDRDSCYVRADESRRIVIYDVRLASCPDVSAR